MNDEHEIVYQDEETGAVLTEAEFHAHVRALADDEIAKRVQRGDLVQVGTAPDGTPFYRGWKPVNQWRQ
jgi:hypothetical protein